MRIFITVLLLFLSVTTNFSQNTESSYWFIGREPRTSTDRSSIAVLDFSGQELQIEKREDIKGISFLGNSSSIASEEGDLLFYSDGCFIYNHQHELMSNGNRINDGEFWGQFCSLANSYPSGHASTIILPAPYKSDEYYLLHQRVEPVSYTHLTLPTTPYV